VSTNCCGAKCRYWPIASFRCCAAFGRFEGFNRHQKYSGCRSPRVCPALEHGAGRMLARRLQNKTPRRGYAWGFLPLIRPIRARGDIGGWYAPELRSRLAARHGGLPSRFGATALHLGMRLFCRAGPRLPGASSRARKTGTLRRSRDPPKRPQQWLPHAGYGRATVPQCTPCLPSLVHRLPRHWPCKTQSLQKRRRWREAIAILPLASPSDQRFASVNYTALAFASGHF
jgi:hypothetical protein